MRYEVIIRTKAANEVDGAYVRYESNTYGLGERFLSELDKCFSSLSEHPMMNAELPENTLYRKMLTATFPYAIVYKVKKDKVTVYRVVHQKRKKRV